MSSCRELLAYSEAAQQKDDKQQRHGNSGEPSVVEERREPLVGAVTKMICPGTADADRLDTPAMPRIGTFCALQTFVALEQRGYLLPAVPPHWGQQSTDGRLAAELGIQLTHVSRHRWLRPSLLSFPSSSCSRRRCVAAGHDQPSSPPNAECPTAEAAVGSAHCGSFCRGANRLTSAYLTGLRFLPIVGPPRSCSPSVETGAQKATLCTSVAKDTNFGIKIC